MYSCRWLQKYVKRVEDPLVQALERPRCFPDVKPAQALKIKLPYVRGKDVPGA
jgi:hypothetical protein